jgi:hypothetical protein
MSATPILDLRQDPPAPRSGKWMTLICLAVGAAIGFAINGSFGSLPGINGLLWIPFLYIAIAIHELGHLVAGKIAGMAPGGLVVGGFVLMKSGDHWTFRFDARRIFGGGLAIPQPAKGDFRVAPFAWMVAAGPIASIISTLICWIAFLKYGSGTGDWIGSCFWASVVGLTSLIPMSAGLNKSDAARLWMLIRQHGETRAWMAAVAIQAENLNGVLPRDWDSALVDQMLAVAQPGSGRIFPDLMAYYRRLDERNEPAAREHLESALRESAKSGNAVRQLLFFEAAEVNALMTGSAANARTWLDRGLKLRKPESRTCVDGAIAMCEGRHGDAIRDIAATRAFILKRKQGSGLARFAQERLNDRERRCEDALHAGATS